jgi:hypothetical protein
MLAFRSPAELTAAIDVAAKAEGLDALAAERAKPVGGDAWRDRREARSRPHPEVASGSFNASW